MTQPAPSGGERSVGLSYQDLLDTDTRQVPEVLRWQSTRELPVVRAAVEKYVSQEYHDLEMERLWRRVWQMACREEEIPEVGDHVVYDIGDISLLIVRAAPDTIKAFHNACLHRGRQLREWSGRADQLRCAFHGWTWNLDGSLKHVPCRWDFPHVEREDYHLPEVKVGTWGGFVFVNPDPEAAPLETHLGELGKHFERWPLEKRHTAAHVAKRLPCNWKVAQEAFMEAYHVVGTHPQLLAGIGDTNSQYDVWDTFSRAITANGTPSPHLSWEPTEQDKLDVILNRPLDQPPMMQTHDDMGAREMGANATRMQMQGIVPGVRDLSDAEMLDSFYYTVFPNFHPWGAYNRLIYRFRPFENDPNQCVMEVYYLAPYRGERPPAVETHWLGEDEDWTCAPELGFLARVFNQDTFNLGKVQRGLRASRGRDLTFSQYQESKIRHFHTLLDQWLAE